MPWVLTIETHGIMDNIQSAILNLQAALQKRPCCDASTQTETVSHNEDMKYHMRLAYKHMMLLEKEVVNTPNTDDVFEGKAAACKGFKTADSVDYWISENNANQVNEDLTDDSDDETARNDLTDVIEGAVGVTYSCSSCGESCEEKDVAQKFGYKTVNGKKKRQTWCRVCRLGALHKQRKKRKRNSGAKDDESFILERHNRVYLAYKPETKSWQMKCVLKNGDESWDDADNTIMRKMREVERNGKTSENSLTEREKLVQLWSEQTGVSYTVGEERARTMTNLELFVAIKKQSPGLVKSGLPNPQ